MEQELTKMELGTPEQREAVTLHYKIQTNLETAASAIVEFCENIKEMRDKKLYHELGFEEFEGYCERMLGIKSRQAYNYISTYERLGKNFLQSNAELGITKLQLLAAMSTEEREKVMESGDVAEMSTQELKAAQEEIRKLKEQISFLEETAVASSEESQQFNADELEAEIRERLAEEMRENLEKERLRATEQARAAATAELEQELKAQKEKLKTEKTKTAEAEKKAQEAEEKAKAAAETVRTAEESIKRAQELENKFKAEQERAERLEKEIKLSKNPALTKFGYKFEDFQVIAQELLMLISELDDESAAKCRNALKTVMEGMGL